MRLLLAFHDSESSDAALRDLPAAGLPDGVEALVVTVAERWLQPPSVAEPRSPGDAARDEPDLALASDTAARGCRRLELMFPTWDVRAAVLAGSPASEILAHADEFGPDLIVVGSDGGSALDRFGLGGAAARLVAEAECSVRVARARRFDRPAHRIVVGIDASDAAQAAVREVARRRWPEGSEALVLTVYDRSVEDGRALDRELRRVDAIQWSAELVLLRTGLRVSRLAVPGDPKRELARQAESWDADCIFVASRGLGRLKRMLLGSVASALAARAGCSVEVVRERAAA